MRHLTTHFGTGVVTPRGPERQITAPSRPVRKQREVLSGCAATSLRLRGSSKRTSPG